MTSANNDHGNGRAVAGLANPENWTWRSAPRAPGPIAIIDVDGVISDGSHRQRHLRKQRPDWKSFFQEADGDAPIAGSAAFLALIGSETTVVLLTARPHTLHQVTLDWLASSGHRWDLLIMRHRSDGGLRSPEFKKRSVQELRALGYEPQFAVDDDMRNVEMFRNEGIETLYLHSGYYEA